ncbi:MAG: alcohol dehydrogenase catalytic domain-containing protein [bacterium]
MRVAMYYHNHDVRVEEMPKPAIGPGEMLVKVASCGICGSDVMEWYRRKKAPLVLGHEMCGEIAELGERAAARYRIGQRVFVSHHVPCNTCRYCLMGHHTACATLQSTNFDPGGFSEYVRVPELQVDRGVYVLPDGVSCEEGTLIEPLACVLRGQRLTGINAGDTVLVIGAGISGLLHIQLARALGAGRIIASDIHESRLEAARRFGADAAISGGGDVVGRLLEINDHRLADLVIICAGTDAVVPSALQTVDNGGSVLFFAVPPAGVQVPIPITDLWRREITLQTSYGASPQDLMTALDLIRLKKLPLLSRMITHRLSLDEAGLGFRMVAEARESIKVLIEPWRQAR